MSRFEDYKRKCLENPEFRKEYERLGNLIAGKSPEEQLQILAEEETSEVMEFQEALQELEGRLKNFRSIDAMTVATSNPKTLTADEIEHGDFDRVLDDLKTDNVREVLDGEGKVLCYLVSVELYEDYLRLRYADAEERIQEIYEECRKYYEEHPEELDEKK